MFAGWVERYPQTWRMEGNFSVVDPVVVDSFGYLSQTKLTAPFYHEVLELGPSFVSPLAEPTGAASFADLTGNHPPAPVASGPYGAGTVASGTSITATTTPGGLFTGAAGPVATMTAAGTGGSTTQPVSFIDLAASGITGPPTTGGWSRMVAFRNSGAGAAAGTLWKAGPASFAAILGLFYIGFGAGASSGIGVQVFGPSTGIIYSPAVGTYADGNWHLLVITQSSNGRTVNIYVDAVLVQSATFGSDQHPLNTYSDVVGAYTYVGSNQYYNGYNGDVAQVAEWPLTLSPTQITKLQTVWRSCCAGEGTGARYSRILRYAGYTGLSSIATGATSAMGAATDLQGGDALTALDNVAVTENGNHYVRADGTLVFEQRTDRYNRLTPTYTFGERTDLGEWPYEEVAFDTDNTKIANDVTITQSTTNRVFREVDLPSQAAHATKSLSRTLNALSTLECADAANYMLSRYKAPHIRITKLRLHPSVITGLWPVALALELGARVRVMRRPPAPAPAIQFDGFIESIAWSVDDLDAYVDMEVSPADLSLYWVHAALRTTLSVQGNSGTATITVLALPDAASNRFAASIPSGLQMTLEPGTVRSETLTVLSVSATSPGYTTATVTFTTNMAFTHPVASVVCEKLPLGITDPTTWDTASVLGTTTTPGY